MSKIKVFYIIFSSSKSSGGGHFHSLKSLVVSLGSNINFIVVNVGLTFPNVLQDLENCEYIKTKTKKPIIPIYKVFKKVKKYKPDIIHAFDAKSLFIARTIAIFFKVKIVYTKCGGANGNSRFLPTSDAQIFFSKENLEFNEKFGNSKVPKFLIPNRVFPPQTDSQHILEFKKKYNLTGKFVVMRISRFNSYYDLTFRQTFELFRSTYKNNRNSILIFVGVVQSDEYFKNLKAEYESENLPILFITEERYITNAKRLIPVSDIIVTTGRGTMEACSYNKMVFCPVQNSSLPIQLTEKTFNFLFATNFSERADWNKLEKDNKEFDNLVFDTEVNTKSIFDKYFNIHNAIPHYMTLYQNVTKLSFMPINYILNSIRYFK